VYHREEDTSLEFGFPHNLPDPSPVQPHLSGDLPVALARLLGIFPATWPC